MLEHRDEYDTEYAAIRSIGARCNVGTETAPGYHGYRNHNRPVQPLKGRIVRLRRGGLND